MPDISAGSDFTSVRVPEEAVQAELLRDILGNPFRPLPRRTFPAHIVGLAQTCHEAFPAIRPEFSILADALADLNDPP